MIEIAEVIPATVESPEPTGFNTLMSEYSLYRMYDCAYLNAPCAPKDTIIHSIPSNKEL